MTLSPPSLDLLALLPQLILCGGALLLILLAMSRRAARPAFSWLSLVVLAAAGVASWRLWGGEEARVAPGLMAGDGLALFGTLVCIVAAALTILHSMGGGEEQRTGPDYYALLLFATSGMSFMVASRDLVCFLVSLEILSISLYVLMGVDRLRPESTEAAMKYFLLGAFATAFAVYGTALVYGGTGTTSLLAMDRVRSEALGGHNPFALAGLALLTVGLGFKISMVPFHAWTPDVYQGSSTPVTAFLSTGSKAAVFVVVLRVFGVSFQAARVDWVGLLAVLSVLTMTVGNVTALRQWDLKRLLAFSSVAHVGYMLVGVTSGAADGAAGVLFYLAAYTAMNLTAFGVVIFLERTGVAAVNIGHFAGLGSRRPVLAAAMTIALLSLAGVPPTAGFVGKFYLFRSAVHADLAWLAVVGVLNSVVSLYYYLRIVVYMFMRSPETELAPAHRRAAGAFALALSVVVILALGLFPNSILRLAQAAASLVG